jgi:D-alanine-D-alanine ligase-like ATP-grasp enzyme
VYNKSVEKAIIRRVVFIESVQPAIDRGFPHRDAAAAVADLGFDVSGIDVVARDELEALAVDRGELLVWPVCFTIGADVAGLLLTAALEELDIPFVGVGSAGAKYGSKLRFKTALATLTSYPSPDYQVIEPGEFPSQRIGYPAVIKTEFSCNSIGVAVANDPAEFTELYDQLKALSGQSIFVERWERAHEYTVAYMPPVSGNPEVAAALELQLNGGARYIDKRVKRDNTFIRFHRPPVEQAIRLQEMTVDIARRLGLDGHFRMDFVENSRGQLFPIEVNLLPNLTRSGPNQSYFPTALSLSTGLTYPTLIERMLAHALGRGLTTHRKNRS